LNVTGNDPDGDAGAAATVAPHADPTATMVIASVGHRLRRRALQLLFIQKPPR
jgi:hypothetical protein